jgi:predicted dienelactone hydrolase
MAEINVAGRRYSASPADEDEYVYTQHTFRDPKEANLLVDWLTGWESVTPVMDRIGDRLRVSVIGHGGIPNYSRVAEISSMCTSRTFAGKKPW